MRLYTHPSSLVELKLTTLIRFCNIKAYQHETLPVARLVKLALHTMFARTDLLSYALLTSIFAPPE